MPLIVMTAPMRAVVGVKLVMLGTTKVKSELELTTVPLAPPTRTLSSPVCAFPGTRTLASVPSSFTSNALTARFSSKLVPPKEMLLSSRTSEKASPLIVMTSPRRAVAGAKLVMLGAVKVKSAVEVTVGPSAPTCTVSFPFWAAAGTRTLISVPPSFTSKAGVARLASKLAPPKETLLYAAFRPKSAPVIVMTSPVRAVVGVKLVMLGGVKVNLAVEVTSLGA